MRNLKRRWFFWLEKLQITRQERFTVTVLIVLILLSHGVKMIVEQQQVEVPESHALLLEQFKERSLAVRSAEIEKPELPKAEDSLKPATSEPDEVTGVKVNINTAGMTELESLPGIGRTYAKRIVEYRERMKGFRSVEELKEVKGIGPRTLEKLRPLVEL